MMLRASKSNTLTGQRHILLRQHGIVQEALRVALPEEPSLRQTWPLVDTWLEACAWMRDWEHVVALVDLVGFVGLNLKVWQRRLVERLRREQQEEGARLDQQIAEHLRSRI